LLRSNLEAVAIEIKDLKHKLDHSSSYTVLSPPCEACVSLNGKLFHATKENTELQQEVTYLTARLEKTVLSKKMIEKDFIQVEESANKSTYRLGVAFDRCEKKGEKSAPKFVPSSSYHKEDEALKPTKAHYPPNPKPSFNPKRGVKRESSKPREKVLCACFVVVLVIWMSFASDVRDLRGGVLSMLGTHIMMSSLIYHLVLILVFRLTRTLMLRLTLFHVLCLASLMDLTIAYMVLIHERTVLSLDALITAHVLIVVIIFHVGLVFLLESPTPTFSRDI
jgi:hypothetical protein